MGHSKQKSKNQEKKPGLFYAIFGPPEQTNRRPNEIKPPKDRRATESVSSSASSNRHQDASAKSAVLISEKPKAQNKFSGETVNHLKPEAGTSPEMNTTQRPQVFIKGDSGNPWGLSKLEKVMKISGIVFLIFVIGYCTFKPAGRPPVAGDPVLDRTGTAVWSDFTEVKINDIRKRVIYNTALKRNIIVVDGTVENVAPYDISHVKLMILLTKKQGSSPSMLQCFTGTIIDDKELITMREAEMKIAFQEMKAMPARIPPKGQISFKAAFPNAPRGYYGVSVRPVYLKKY